MNFKYLKVWSLVLASTLLVSSAPTKVEAKNLTNAQKAIIGTSTGGAGLLTLGGLIFFVCRNRPKNNTSYVSGNSAGNRGSNNSNSYQVSKSVPPTSVQEVANTLRFLAENYLNLVSQNGFNYAINVYSIKTCGKKYEDLMDEIRQSKNLDESENYSSIYKLVAGDPSYGGAKHQFIENVCYLLKIAGESAITFDYSLNPNQIMPLQAVANVVFKCCFSNSGVVDLNNDLVGLSNDSLETELETLIIAEREFLITYNR